LNVCATVPDLGSLCEAVGGDEVQVTVFAKGTQDPHFMEAKPSYILALNKADLFLEVGLDLEIGWAPRLQETARNPRVLLGGNGFLDASRAIEPLEAPAGIVDRTLGDVHPLGNPHYLLDPLNGRRVARLIRDKLSELRPAKRESFEGRYLAFARKLAVALLGEKLLEKYDPEGKDPEKILRLYELGKLEPFLESQGDTKLLGGWVGRTAAFRGAPVVGDHNMWPYFARRFDLDIVGHLEPKPGIAPTTRHMTEIVEKMKSLKARAILAVVYFDCRHADFVSSKTGVPVLHLAHQAGSRDSTDDYLAVTEYNVREIEKALGEKR
jgi:ABC-type Zn uptake system ZnuABC Zn-binding protein ZnuA